MLLRCGRYRLPLDGPRLMGVINLTPDSFSDGGRHATPEAALARARVLCEQGAALIDIGGESTRPGAQPVDLDEERRRVLPVLECLVDALDVPVSVDTSKPALMRDAIAAGAGMINDVNAFRAEGAWDTVAAAGTVALVVMHRQGEPATMQRDPRYRDVTAEVECFLRERRRSALAAGIAPERLVFDPGFGFGKSLAHNLTLLRDLPRLADELSPLLVGLSRKSMFAHLLGERPPEARIAASVQAAMLAVQGGAAILRVHDVAETREALTLLAAVQRGDR